MSTAAKLLEKMRHNPRDWRIDDLKTIADRYGIAWRQQGTSHVTFRHPGAAKISIPAHKPIKSVYIRQFLAMMDLIGEEVP